MAVFSEAVCQANGIEIHYRRSGGQKPPIVLLHGFTDDGACWIPFARELAAEWDAIMPDARGHGLSSVPESGYQISDLAADVIGFIEALGLERPVLGGHSMGGITAAVVAGERPDLVRALVLEDPAFFARDGGAEAEAERLERMRRWRENHRQVLATPLDQLIAARKSECPHWTDETVELWARSKHLTKLEAFEPRHGGFPDYRDVVRKIQCPALIVTGERERGAIVSDEMAAVIAQLNPAVRVEKIAGAGHCVRYDRPEEFTRVVLAYLKELRG